MPNQTRILEAYTYTIYKNGGTRKVLVGTITKNIYGTLLGAVVFMTN